MLLRVFRAVATAWSVSAFPGSNDVLRYSARRALGGLGNVQLPPAERAAAYALAAIVAPSNETPARATTALEYALDAAGAQGRAAFEQTLEVIRTDAALLDERFSPVTLANSKLWPGEPPDWQQELWEELKHRLLAENEGWEVWTLWYEARLSGEHSSDQIELRWAALPDDAWEHELGTVNRALEALTVTHEDTSELDSLERTDTQPNQPGRLQGVEAVGQVGTIVGQVSITATAEVIPDPAIEAVVSRIKSDPQTFEDIARFAARSIETELKELATKIPNEPAALAGYEEVRAVLQRLQTGFEELAVAVHDSTELADPVEQTSLLRRAVRVARSMSEGFVGWLDDNGSKAGRVIAELGLAGVIAGTLSYFVGIPPLVSFSVTAAALKGKSIWDAIVLFAPQKKGGDKGD
ncbi:hypothetical protein [Bradyrhizobium sp. LMG 9283]|uniref:hypothetical protein n=1 Tax=Bradyrhizobium sp. LMG 9283 TaxID=592064 RepID=UPI00388FC088